VLILTGGEVILEDSERIVEVEAVIFKDEQRIINNAGVCPQPNQAPPGRPGW